MVYSKIKKYLWKLALATLRIFLLCFPRCHDIRKWMTNSCSIHPRKPWEKNLKIKKKIYFYGNPISKDFNQFSWILRTKYIFQVNNWLNKFINFYLLEWIDLVKNYWKLVNKNYKNLIKKIIEFKIEQLSFFAINFHFLANIFWSNHFFYQTLSNC